MSDGLKVRVTKTGRVRGPNLSDPQLKAVGDAMVAAQLERWSKAINADGNPAKKLSVRYAIIKQKSLGKKPVRDMSMTGMTVANFKLRKAAQGVIRAENSTRMARAHATRASLYEQMIGFAGTDQVAIFRASQEQYGKWLQKAWVPVT